MSACGQTGRVIDSTDSTIDVAVENVSIQSGSSNVDSDSTVEGASSAVQSLDVSDMFTDRDKEVGYDENEAVQITLNGTSATCEDASVQIDGTTVTITDEGTYVLSGTLEDGMVIVDADDADKLQIVLNGVTITNSTSAALYIKQADKVFVTTASGTVNTLSSTGEFVAIDDNNIDAAIFSKEDLTLNGLGTLIVQADYGHGIVSKDDLVITSGTYEITSGDHGLAGKDSVRIASGDIQITCAEDGIHSGNDDDETKGFTYIAGGNIAITAGDDGIHSDTQVVITGGNIDIVKSYEGIEGKVIEIAGGKTSVVASDDGLNAASGSSTETFLDRGMMDEAEEGVYILISGGELAVNANGDGLDSNGDFYVTGGETYVSGPTNGGNGALDYAGEARITGGILVAAGYSGMEQNMGSTSTQGSILMNTDSVQEAGSSIELKDSAGNVLVSYNPEKNYNSVVVSTPDIVVGETYTLDIGTESNEITMSEILYGEGTGFGGFGGGFGGRPGFGGDMEFDEKFEFDENEDGFGRRGRGFGKGMKEDGFNGERPEMPEGDFDGGFPKINFDDNRTWD
ncbi:MAG: carbohydrate-binding domain-containing protein [Lachnospiraceae bacterium]|nr:carbohydrate-binding domain-containing protein [Lachnospiraceae bacterium]